MIYDEKEREAQYRTAESDDTKISSQQEILPPAPAPKKKKGAFITAGSLIIAGAAILFVGAAMKSDNTATSVDETTSFDYISFSEEAGDFMLSGNASIIDVTNVTSVVFDCSAADVVIVPSNVFSYEITDHGEVHSTVDDNGVMTISYSGDNGNFLNGDFGTLYVTVPEQMIDSLEVHLNAGSLNISQLKKEKITFDLNAVDLDASNITANEIVIDTKAGSINAEVLTANNFSVNSSASDSYFNDVSAQTAEFVSNAGSCSVVNGNVSKLTLNGKMGELDYSGAIEEAADISLDMGNSVIDLYGSPSEYDIREVNGKMSDITINDMDIGEFNQANESGDIPINITSNMSTVSINAQ